MHKWFFFLMEVLRNASTRNYKVAELEMCAHLITISLSNYIRYNDFKLISYFLKLFKIVAI